MIVGERPNRVARNVRAHGEAGGTRTAFPVRQVLSPPGSCSLQGQPLLCLSSFVRVDRDPSSDGSQVVKFKQEPKATTRLKFL